MDSRSQVPSAVAAFLLGSLGWMVVVGMVTWLAMLGVALASGATFADFQATPEAWMSPGVMGFSALVQSAGIGAITVALAQTFADEPVRDAIAGPVRSPWLGWVLCGAAGALTVGFLPGWIASRIVERFPEVGGALGVVAEAMQSEAPFGKALLVLAICVTAPIFEEVAFRGYLWHQLEQVLPSWAVWLATTLLFTLYHLDPVQSPSLLPTALFLGWLRWRSGSIVPAIVGHFVNNGLACIALLTASGTADAEIGFAGAALGTLATVLCCGVAWWAHPRS
ncbi:MAG: CPBP family intramembrane glutamic endopeptidase [Myxococcota bacterium]